MSIILSIENLYMSFDGVSPLKDVSFIVREQSIVVITGENGVGKTTLFNLITGLEKPKKGRISFKGTNILFKSALQISRLGITRLYQQPRLFKNLLVWENLVSAAHPKIGNSLLNLILKSKKIRNEDELLKIKANNLLEKFGLHDLSKQKVGELSYGQQKLVSFCMIIMNESQLVLLDEPFAGMNPKAIDQFCNMILEMRKEGATFLIIEHNINKALTIADNLLVMKEGVIDNIKVR